MGDVRSTVSAGARSTETSGLLIVDGDEALGPTVELAPLRVALLTETASAGDRVAMRLRNDGATVTVADAVPDTEELRTLLAQDPAALVLVTGSLGKPPPMIEWLLQHPRVRPLRLLRVPRAATPEVLEELTVRLQLIVDHEQRLVETVLAEADAAARRPSSRPPPRGSGSVPPPPPSARKALRRVPEPLDGVSPGRLLRALASREVTAALLATFGDRDDPSSVSGKIRVDLVDGILVGAWGRATLGASGAREEVSGTRAISTLLKARDVRVLLDAQPRAGTLNLLSSVGEALVASTPEDATAAAPTRDSQLPPAPPRLGLKPPGTYRAPFGTIPPPAPREELPSLSEFRHPSILPPLPR